MIGVLCAITVPILCRSPLPIISTMQEALEKEREATLKQWEKRREQPNRVMQATVRMYDDSQGIAGKSLPEIEGRELSPLNDKTAQQRLLVP